MNYFRLTKHIIPYSTCWKQGTNVQKCNNLNKYIFKSLCTSKWFQNQDTVPKALRNIKPKSQSDTERSVLDIKHV